MSIQFMLTVDDDGTVYLTKFGSYVDPAGNLDPTFKPAMMQPEDSVDLHVKVEQVKKDKTHARLIHVALTDDTIPAFANVEQAEEWMAARSQLKVLS